jgi:hypothetical protein
MTALEFILLTQLNALLTVAVGGLDQLVSGIITEFVHLLNVIVSFFGALLPQAAPPA